MLSKMKLISRNIPPSVRFNTISEIKEYRLWWNNSFILTSTQLLEVSEYGIFRKYLASTKKYENMENGIFRDSSQKFNLSFRFKGLLLEFELGLLRLKDPTLAQNNRKWFIGGGNVTQPKIRFTMASLIFFLVLS